MESLPPVMAVLRTLTTLVSDNCLLRPWDKHFLNAGSRMGGRASRIQETHIQEIADASGTEWPDVFGDSVPAGQHIEDAKRLTATELKVRYKTTYSSWQNMKGRRRSGGAIIHPDFEQFSSFLCEVGPRPSKQHTLDRKDPSDREYAPGKVRWLDKKGQSNNREVTILLTHGGETKPLTIWAEETRQEADTLRSRRRKRWTDSEVILGRRSATQLSDLRPWDSHDDVSMTLAAEKFYLANRRPADTPLSFCLECFRLGLDPWEQYLRDEFDESDEGASDFYRTIEAARKMLVKLVPVRQWLSDVVAASTLHRPSFRPRKYGRFAADEDGDNGPGEGSDTW